MLKNFMPTYISKFHRDSEYLEKLLLNNELFFSGLETFNDPFETLFVLDKNANMKPGYYTSPSRGEKYLETTEEIAEYYREIVSVIKRIYLDTIGIASFTINPYNQLMWSHYAQNHTGVCLLFDTLEDNKFFKEIDKVEYKEVLPKIESPQNIEALATQVIEILFSKNKIWSYEEEYRMINPIGVHKFLPSSLDTIIFGCKMTEVRKLTLKKLCEPKYPNITFLDAKINPNDYMIEFVNNKTGEISDLIFDIDFEAQKNKTMEILCVADRGIKCSCPKCVP